MLTVEEVVEVRVLARQGKGIREIARDLGLSRNTVRRYLRRAEGPPRRRPAARASKLDAHKDYLARRLAEAAPARLAATVLLRELRERGYDGGYSILTAYLATLRPAVPAEPVVRFETEPGAQMQVDWAVIRRGADRLSVFVATLGWSRAAYVEFVTDEKLATWLGCHERAFAAFGGVPRTVLYDNLRAVVTARDAYGPGEHRFNPAFLDFAGHCGFVPKLCQPYRAQTKGKVERFIRYLRQSFWVPLSSRLAADGVVVDAPAANRAARLWLRDVANARCHATTGVVPAQRLAVEREHLQPVPPPWDGDLRAARPAVAAAVAAVTAGPLPSVTMPAGLPLTSGVLQHPLSLYEALLAPEVA